MSREPDGITIPDRLDAALVALGLVESRSKAQRLIKAGKVMVDGTVITKSSQSIASAADIAIDKGDDYVSRGAYKLIGAFEAFRSEGLPDPSGLSCLDIGASTGGSATCCCAVAPAVSSRLTSATASSTRASRTIRASSR